MSRPGTVGTIELVVRADLHIHTWRILGGSFSMATLPDEFVPLIIRAPRSAILRAEIGKSFLAPRYRENGSVVAQILFLKPLKSKAK